MELEWTIYKNIQRRVKKCKTTNQIKERKMARIKRKKGTPIYTYLKLLHYK